jgi:hypothetical protein
MASRITIYGNPAQPDVRRLTREMSALYVEYDLADPRKDDRAARRLQSELGSAVTLPLVEVLRADDQGSVFLTNPDAAALRQCLYSEEILSVTSYWL